jgi:hypothetical protein
VTLGEQHLTSAVAGSIKRAWSAGRLGCGRETVSATSGRLACEPGPQTLPGNESGQIAVSVVRFPAPLQDLPHYYEPSRPCAPPRYPAARGARRSRSSSVPPIDASAVVHARSSSRRTPDPLIAGLFPQRSPPRLLTGAACGGLGSPPARRTRRTCLHHWHSTVRAGDLLHRLTPLSGRTTERRFLQAQPESSLYFETRLGALWPTGWSSAQCGASPMASTAVTRSYSGPDSSCSATRTTWSSTRRW